MSSINSSTETDVRFNTKKNIIKDSFTWTLEKFSLCKLIEDKGRASPLFTSKKNDTIKWSLYLYPTDPYSDGKDYISLCLALEDCRCIELTTFCSFYVLSTDSEKKHKKVMSITKFNETKTIYPCIQFLKHDLLLNDDNNELLSNGNFTLGCEIFYYYGVINTIDLSTNNNTNEYMDLLLDDIAGMLKSPKFSDCVIKVGDTEINVHKCILASRSEVFDSILVDEHCEFDSNIIEIKGFSLKVIEEMVTYLYTGKSPNMDKMACEMLEIGDKYKLKPLKTAAEESLIKKVNIYNVCKYLVKSELYSGEILKEWCLQFIYLNAKNVVNRRGWKKVVNDYPSLIAKLFNIAVGID